MDNKVVDLVKYIATQFANNKESLVFDTMETDNDVTIIIKALPEDMGRIIGKQGRIAMAMRTIAKTIQSEDKKKYFIEIKDL